MPNPTPGQLACDTPTPGQICYEAHAHVWDPAMLCTPPWRCLPPKHRAAWEAAAQAVLAQCPPQAERTTTDTALFKLLCQVFSVRRDVLDEVLHRVGLSAQAQSALTTVVLCPACRQQLPATTRFYGFTIASGPPEVCVVHGQPAHRVWQGEPDDAPITLASHPCPWCGEETCNTTCLRPRQADAEDTP
jgi:hypothetical protein